MNEQELALAEAEAKIQAYVHIDKIREMLRLFATELVTRGETHDRSKMSELESKTFAIFTPKLKGSTYGSDEYNRFLLDMEPALDHHYANNRHHPEFFRQGTEWRPVVGFEGQYEVNSHGWVRSLDREVARTGPTGSLSKKGRILRLYETPKGYLRVQLQHGGKSKNCMTHRLVAEAFIPNPDGKPEVNHRNGIKDDNYFGNLEWVTASENQLHAYETELKHAAVQYVVTCEELNITTLGCEEMARELRSRGHDKVLSSGIWGAIHRDGKHLDLTFTATLLKDHPCSLIDGMNLLDVMEMWIDWYCSSMRHANGSMAKSIEINEGRFKMSPQLVAIFKNTLRDLDEGTLSKNRPSAAAPSADPHNG
jgi:hypothetical protein